MIEIIIRDFLKKELNLQVEFEKYNKIQKPFVLMEQTSSGKSNQLFSKTLAFQSYGSDLLETIELNHKVKKAVEKLTILNDVVSVRLNSDYNYTETSTKEYRYQAVFDIKHY